jgi:hypothetical protein
MTTMALLTSCEKSEDFAPSIKQSQAVEPIRPTRKLTLDMWMREHNYVSDVHLYKMQSTKTYLFQEGGYRYEWNINNEQYTLLFQVDVDTLDQVKHITGRYNGDTFVMWQGVLNFCGGAQGVRFNYTIYKN